MTKEEELFVQFFNAEVPIVIHLDDIQLTERRTEIIKILTEAKAKVAAIDEEVRERKAKKGVKARIAGDDSTATNAANAAKRKITGKLTKEEKLIQSMMALGMSETDAKNAVSRGRVQSSLTENKPTQSVPNVQDLVNTIISASKPTTTEPFVDPFALPQANETKTTTTVTVNEQTDVIVIEKTTEPVKESPKADFNPFA